MKRALIIKPTFIEETFAPHLSTDGSIQADKRLFEVSPISGQHRILKFLAERKTGLLRRDELIGIVYGEIFELDPTVSLRTTANRYNTAVKTLSRLRIELERFFGDLMPPGFQWFPWNERLNGWLLFARGAVDQSMTLKLNPV